MIISFLLYFSWNPSPEIFTIPGINWPLRWYGLLFVGGFLVAQQVMCKIFKTEKKAKELVDSLTIYLLVGTVLGARLGHVLFYDPVYYFNNPASILKTWEGGLASHGGAIGILIALFLFTRKHKINYLWMLDKLVIVVGVVASMIRFGNFMNSEIVGIKTTMPWGIHFERIDAEIIYRHPAQLYESIYCMALFVMLYFLWKRYRTTWNNGILFGIFLIGMFSLRFLVEFVKIDQETWEAGMFLNMGQILSIPFVLAGIGMLLWRKNKGWNVLAKNKRES